MNTLYIKNDEIQLIGFEKICDKIFFSFRNSGLVISSEKQEIESPQIEEVVNEHKIHSPALASKLVKYGFQNSHSFTFHNQEYYCPYIFD